MIQYIHKTLKSEKLHILDEFKPGVWVYVEDPNHRELEKISTDFKLDIDLLKDALDPHEVSRIDMEENVHYVFARYALEDNDGTSTEPVLLVISNDCLITVCRKRPAFYDNFMSGKVEFFTTQKTKLFIQIFLDIIQHYQRILNQIRKQIRTLTLHIEKIKNQDLVNFVAYESTLYDILTSLEPMEATLKQILSGSYLKLFDQDADLVEDLQLSVMQLVDICQSTLSHIVNVRDANTTITTNNINRTMKFLTVLTLALTIPTMIASLFGMNVNLPLQDHPLAFGIILILATLTSISILTYLLRKDYL